MVEEHLIAERDRCVEGGAGRLFIRHWEPARPVASLVICHGFNAHSGHYARAAEVFAARGFAVTAFDLRGRGQSDGARFEVETFDEYVGDLSTVVALVQAETPDPPTYVLGHSAGGVIAATFAMAHQDRTAGLISESIALHVPAPDIALKLLRGASHIAPHVPVLRLKPADFSRDPAWIAHLDADPLIDHEVQPIQTVAALARASERIEHGADRITLPLLILHGTADRATRPDGSQRLFDTAGSTDRTLRFYEGFAHDLLNDVGRDRVLNDIGNWIAKRTPFEK